MGQTLTLTSVMKPFSAVPVRLRPKSQILRSQFALSRRLLGFRSRCRTFALWMYFSPLKICIAHVRRVQPGVN